MRRNTSRESRAYRPGGRSNSTRTIRWTDGGQTVDILVPPIMEKICEHSVAVSVPQVSGQFLRVPKNGDNFHERRDETVAEQVSMSSFGES